MGSKRSKINKSYRNCNGLRRMQNNARRAREAFLAANQGENNNVDEGEIVIDAPALVQEREGEFAIGASGLVQEPEGEFSIEAQGGPNVGFYIRWG